VSKQKPSFSQKSELIRYVDEANRLSNNRPAVATFLPDPPSAEPWNDHLSVNSLEVEDLKQIAAYHRWKWQDDNGAVALCIHKVHDYTDAGRKAGVDISYDKANAIWQFLDSTQKRGEAYKHRPVKAHGSPPHGSPSHCGVEFSREIKEHEAAKFARRLCRNKFHLVK